MSEIKIIYEKRLSWWNKEFKDIKMKIMSIKCHKLKGYYHKKDTSNK